MPKLIITKWVDEDGNELKPADAKAPSELGESNEAFEHGEIDGYVFVRTLTDETEGTVTHIFRKLQDTTAPTVPVVNPVKAGGTTLADKSELDLIKVQPVRQRRVATISSKKSESGELPNTGEEQSVASIGLAILSALTGGLLISKKRKDEE